MLRNKKPSSPVMILPECTPRMMWTATKTSPSPGWIVSHVVNAATTYVLARAAFGFENVTSALAFYGVYHREPWNQFIHFFGVPGIIYSLWIYQCHLPLTDAVIIDFLPGVPAHYINWATLWFGVYTVFYFSIDTVGAALYFPFTYAMYASAVRYVVSDQYQYRSSGLNKSNDRIAAFNWTGTGMPLCVAGVIHALSWLAQIKFGHQMIEGAQPAILQSFGGAFSTAPLFAFYEAVWYLGFQKDFHRTVIDQVAIYTEELCSKGVQMAACSSI